MKKYILSILVLSLIVFSSCSDTGSTGQQSSTTQLFRGTQGVKFSFLDNLPPSKIYLTDGTYNFDVNVEIRNYGTYEIQPGELFFSFSGLDNNIVSYPTNTLGITRKLDAKTNYMPEGGFLIEALGELSPNRNEIGSEYNPTLVLSAFYKYETRATVPICVDPKAYDPRATGKACTAGDVTLSGGQGAPVAVTKVEQVSSPDKLILKIYFSNVGGGDLFNIESGVGQTINNAAENGINLQNQNKLTATVKLGSQTLTCQPTNTAFRVSDILYCTYNIDSNTVEAYSTVLDITASYGYKETIRKQLNIINLS